MLSRLYSRPNTDTGKLKHATLSPHIELFQLKPNNSLPPTNCFAKHVENTSYNKKNSLSILAGYGNNQFLPKIEDTGIGVSFATLSSLSFESVTLSQNNYKKCVKM